MGVRLPQTVRCGSLEEFMAWQSYSAVRDAEIARFEAELVKCRQEAFTIPGTCAVCNADVEFHVDYQYCLPEADGGRTPNWRERLICPSCGLNNRQRAAVGFLLSLSRPDDRVYLTEAVTTLSKAVMSKRENVVGSEYLRDGTARGASNAQGIRHEDATCLTFEDNRFDLIGTFDVLEHVPGYSDALQEFYRCLAPGGTLIITVPFSLESDTNIVRAVVTPSGEIEHLLPADIHGDPIDDEGALCFYHFGWELVSKLREIGFTEAGLYFFWSSRLGHLGGNQSVILGRKPLARLPLKV
jgi:SAM-dependent methyltransferase